MAFRRGNRLRTAVEVDFRRILAFYSGAYAFLTPRRPFLARSFIVMRSLRIREALAFDGDFSAAGFVELRV
jgi:hypothetical protein